MLPIRKRTTKFLPEGPRWWCLAAAILLVLPVEAAIPGFEMQHLGFMLQPDYRLSYVLAEDSSQGRVLLFGGSTIFSSGTPMIREYSASSNTWQVLPVQLPYSYHQNERHSAAQASNGRYYLGPGNGPGGWGQNDQIIEVDVETGTALERAFIVGPGSNIWGVALATAPQGGVYLFGGWNGGGTDAIRHYDPQTNLVRTLAARLTAPRTVGVRLAHPNGRIYLFGGNTDWTASHRAAEVFDPATETLRALPNPSLFGFNHGTQAWVGADQAIYLWNPEASYLGNGSGTTVRFDPVQESFQDLGGQPSSDHYALGVWRDASDGDVYFFGLVLPGYVWGSSGQSAGEVWRLRDEDPTPDNCSQVAFPGPDHCVDAPPGDPLCDLDGWSLAGIGSANQLGARVIAAGDYRLALTADGSTAYLASDNAGFYYREVAGDFRFEATLDSSPMTTGKEWRKAGLMARASLDDWDIRLLALLAPVQARLQFVAREIYGGPGNVKLAYEVEGAPGVVRLSLERVGQTLTVQYSLDGGDTWITPATALGGSIEIPDLPEVLLVGLAMISNNVSVTSTGHFDDISLLCESDP
jgi:hypothetical protein